MYTKDRLNKMPTERYVGLRLIAHGAVLSRVPLPSAFAKYQPTGRSYGWS